MKLEIKKFKSVQNLTLEIPAILKGGNGLGKTTVLEAISFVLTGKDLSGAEFKQVYDYRVDLKEAVADVSFFDAYGNEYRRVVSPVFQVNRQGVEELKILRNTQCSKNGIAVNDYSAEFTDFLKFGTDYFFRQKEDEQRKIFIDVLKGQLPDYDVQEAQSNLKSLKRAVKIAQTEIGNIIKVQKKFADVVVPEMDSDLERLHNEFQAATKVDAESVERINKANNKAAEDYRVEKSILESIIDSHQSKIRIAKRKIEDANHELERISGAEFIEKQLHDVSEVMEEIANLEAELLEHPKYDSVSDYFNAEGHRNPVVAENIAKIKEIQAGEVELETACPCCGVESEVSKEKAYELAISDLKRQNKAILERELEGINLKRSRILRELDNVEQKLAKLQSLNFEAEKYNREGLILFEKERTEKLNMYTAGIKQHESEIEIAEGDLSGFTNQLSELKSPTPIKLPEAVEVSAELREANEQYLALEKSIVESEAINRNNARLRGENEAEKENHREAIMELDAEIVRLQAEITDYFSNLDGVVKKEFAGEIEIGVELLEYVIRNDEYKDCFKITANGKKFPFECNGALQNNVKLQVLATLQRLIGYNGITVMDNTEANTTEPLNMSGLNCIVAGATSDKELIISN